MIAQETHESFHLNQIEFGSRDTSILQNNHNPIWYLHKRFLTDNAKDFFLIGHCLPFSTKKELVMNHHLSTLHNKMGW